MMRNSLLDYKSAVRISYRSSSSVADIQNLDNRIKRAREPLSCTVVFRVLLKYERVQHMTEAPIERTTIQ